MLSIRWQRGLLFDSALLLLTLIVLGFFSSALIAQHNDQDEIEDYQIERAIETDLAYDDGVSAHLIDVSSKDGIVTLSGTVDNVMAQDRAIEIAQSIKGVRSVVNKIQVKPVNRTDPQIRRDVLDILVSDPVTESYDISVSVAEGVVTLSGNVDSWPERKFASDLAKSAKGVVRVVNELDVAFEEERPDEEIQQEIEAKLQNSVWIDGSLIEVSVQDGVVMLNGTVGSAIEKERARYAAYVAGVERVNDENLDVEWWAQDEMRKQDRIPDFTDDEMRQAVYDAMLYDPRVNPTKIDINVADAVVSLTGSVSNYGAREAAEQDAQNTMGVARVFNHLKVRPDLVVEDQKIMDYVDNAIKRDPYIERYNVDLGVINGKVYLNGAVDTEFDKMRVEQITGRQPGVVDVANNMVVRKQWEPKSDWALKKDVHNQFFWSMVVDGSDITVNVNDGRVTLTGKVGDRYEAQMAVKNAYEAGARMVENDLTITSGVEIPATYEMPPYTGTYGWYHY